MTISPITTTNNLILRVTGNAEPELIRLVMGASAAPVHRSGPWYTVEIAGAAYGDDKPREIVLPCNIAIKVVHVTDRSLDNLYFVQKTPRTPPNFRVFDEHDNMLCGEFEAPPSPPPSPPSPTLTLTLTTQPASRSCHIFWDIENCSIGKGDNLGVISNRILEAIKDAVGYGWTPTVVRKAVYIDMSRPSHRTDYRVPDLEDHLWERIDYGMKGSADSAIMASMNMLAIENRTRPANERPVVCLITGDRDFSVTLQFLQMEGWKDVVLIHTPQARETFTEHATCSVNWADIRSGAWSPSAVPRHVRDFIHEMLNADGVNKSIAEIEMHVYTKCSVLGLPVPNLPLDDILRANPTAIDQTWVEDGRLWKIAPARNIVVPLTIAMEWLSEYLFFDERLDRVRRDVRITTRSGQFVDVTGKTRRDRDEAAGIIEDLVQRLTDTRKVINLEKEQWTPTHVREIMKPPMTEAWKKEFKIVANFVHNNTATSIRIVGERAAEAVEAFHARFVPVQLRISADLKGRKKQTIPVADLETQYGLFVRLPMSDCQEITCLGIDGERFRAGMEYLQRWLTSEMVAAEHTVRSRTVWLYLHKFFDLFERYFLEEYGVQMSRGATKMTISFHGQEEGVARVIQYMKTQLSEERMRYRKIDIQNCPSHKYQSIYGMIHAKWHSEIARRQAECHNDASDPLQAGLRGLAFISVSPAPPKNKKSIPDTFSFPLLMSVEVWLHENHVPGLFDEIITSITNADQYFKFIEVDFSDRQSEFYGKIMDKIGQKHSRDFIYQTFGVSGVVWRYEEATMQLWGIRDGCVDRAYAWIME